MEQLPAPTPLPACPKCNQHDGVQATVASNFGVYLRCAQCGHMWHHRTTNPEPKSAA